MEKDNSRRDFLQNAAVLAAAGVAGVASTASADEKIVSKSKGKMSIAPGREKVNVTTLENTKLSTVPLNWKEVFYTNCPLISASNVDQELGWTKEEFKKIGVNYSFLRSRRENDWYPHYIHNLDNTIRFGGLFPPIHAHADMRRTVLLGVTQAYEGSDDFINTLDAYGPQIGVAFHF